MSVSLYSYNCMYVWPSLPVLTLPFLSTLHNPLSCSCSIVFFMYIRKYLSLICFWFFFLLHVDFCCLFFSSRSLSRCILLAPYWINWNSLCRFGVLWKLIGKNRSIFGQQHTRMLKLVWTKMEWYIFCCFISHSCNVS